MRDYFRLVEREINTGKEFVLCEGAYNECNDTFESMYGFTFYEGIEVNGSEFYIEEI